MEEIKRIINTDKWEKIATISVDSGQMMFVDPCYVLSKTEYKQLLDERKIRGNMEPCEFKRGVVHNTYGGDGYFHVFAHTDEIGRVREMRIIFDVQQVTIKGETQDVDTQTLMQMIWDRDEKK